jgi:hypothetical protein
MLRRNIGLERKEMLEEWIRNVPVATLKEIAADPKTQGSRIWQLAVVELLVRQNQDALAA